MPTTKTTAPKALATQVEPEPLDPALIEQVMIGGDLSKLNPQQKLAYYKALCDSLQLNYLTRPFEYMTLDGKAVLYARKDCTDQIRKRDGVQITIKERKTEDGIHMVIAHGKNASGREDESIGVVSMVEPTVISEWENRVKVRKPNPFAGKPLSAADRAVSMMRAETKAKRRVTLSLGGLGMMDESEIEDIPIHLSEPTVDAPATLPAGAKVIDINAEPAKPVSSKTPEPHDWRKAIVHVGPASAKNKFLGDIAAEVLYWLYDEWMPRLPVKPVKVDAKLRDAVTEAVKEVERPAKEEPEAPETPASDESATQPLPTEENAATGRTGAEKGQSDVLFDEELPKKTTEAPKMDWRTRKLPSFSKLKGTELSKLTVPQLRSVVREGLPLCLAIPEDQRDTETKIFINAVYAMEAEEQPFQHKEYLDSLDEETARAEVQRRIVWAGVSVEDGVKRIIAAGGLDVKRKLSKSSLAECRLLLDRWYGQENGAAGVESIVKGEE